MFVVEWRDGALMLVDPQEDEASGSSRPTTRCGSSCAAAAPSGDGCGSWSATTAAAACSTSPGIPLERQ